MSFESFVNDMALKLQAVFKEVKTGFPEGLKEAAGHYLNLMASRVVYWWDLLYVWVGAHMYLVITSLVAVMFAAGCAVLFFKWRALKDELDFQLHLYLSTIDDLMYMEDAVDSLSGSLDELAVLYDEKVKEPITQGFSAPRNELAIF